MFAGWVKGLTHLVPPVTNRFNRKFSGIMVNANTNPAFVQREIINAIRNCLPELGVKEIMHPHFNRLLFGMPLLSWVFKLTNQFLLIRIDANRRLIQALELLYLLCNVQKLGISVLMRRAVTGFTIRL